MKIFLILTIIASFSILSVMHQVEAIPYASTQDLYDWHDVILLGKVISKNSTFSSTHFLYEIKVEKYLKNPQPHDVVTAAGLNSFNSHLGNTVFEVGDNGLFFLNNYTQKYDSSKSPLSISPRSIKVPPELSKQSGQPIKIEVEKTKQNIESAKSVVKYNDPPLKQIKAGTKPHNVVCDSGLELAKKKGGETSACVKLDTKIELTVRGWANDDRVILGCIGERYSICYPEDKGEYRKLLQKYYGLDAEPKGETFLSKTIKDWQDMSEDQLNPYYNKYKDNFFTELGRFLIKDEMQKELQRHGIENKHEDFKVFSGNVLTSLPPHISYHAVVNATDGNSYLLEGGTFANEVRSVRVNQLAFYDNVLNSSKTTQGDMPYEQLLEMESKVVISPQEGNAPIVEPSSLILDLEKNNLVTFYNNLTIPIRIQEYGSGFVEDEDKISWKSIIIAPKQSVSIQFNVTGHYQWNARSTPNASEQWWGYQGGGEIAVFSNETQNLSFEEKMAIARTFLSNSRPDIPWTGMGSSNDGIDILLNDAIFYMIPDAERYYKGRAQQWVPFDVPIIIVAPKSFEKIN